MHLVENYALAAGVKISEPHIDPLFYPVPEGKYIVLHASSGMKSKNYDHYNEVLKLIEKYIEKENIQIVQIGEESDKRIKGTIDYLGKTNLRQTFYVIQKSCLLLGNDSFSSHVSSFLRIPTVTLFGASLPETCKPYWHDKEKLSIFSPDFSSRKPSYCVDEVEKRVNEIFPDYVAERVLHHLEIKNNMKGVEAIHLGDSYRHGIVDLVPNFDPEGAVEAKGAISIRCDYTDKVTNLEHWVSKHKCAIYTDKELDIDLLIKHKHNIQIIVLYIKDDELLKSIDKFRTIGKKIQIFYYGKRNISDVRLELFEEQVNEPFRLSKKDLDNPTKLCDNSYFKSSLKILSENKIYPCKAYLDRNIESSEKQKVIDCPEYYNEIEYFKIYNHDNKN